MYRIFKYSDTSEFTVMKIVTLIAVLVTASIRVEYSKSPANQIMLLVAFGLSVITFICLCVWSSLPYIMLSKDSLYVRSDKLLPIYRVVNIKGISNVYQFGSKICVEYGSGKLSSDINLQELSVIDAHVLLICLEQKTSEMFQLEK